MLGEEADGVSLSLSDEAMAEDCARLRQTAADSFKTDNTGFTARVIRDSANLVFFSVPYDEGWTAFSKSTRRSRPSICIWTTTRPDAVPQKP